MEKNGRKREGKEIEKKKIKKEGGNSKEEVGAGEDKEKKGR